MSLLLVLGGDVADFRSCFFCVVFTVVFSPAQRIVKIDIKSIFEVQNGIPLRSEGGERIPGFAFVK